MSKVDNIFTIERMEKWGSEKVSIRFTDQDTQDAVITNVQQSKKSEDQERQPFSFELLTSMKQKYYPQGTFLVTFPDGTEELIFMVPIGVDASTGGIKYEIIFN